MTIHSIIPYRGEEIKIYYDDYAQSPDTWEDTDQFLVYDHRQFYVERKKFDPSDIYEHCAKIKRMFYNGYYVFPVYAYIHSGVSLSLGRNTYPFNDGWDVSYGGFCLVKRTKKSSWFRSKARIIAENVVEEWNQYLSGEVYGFDIGNDACGGYYGKDGLKEAIEEAKGSIDYIIKYHNKEKLKKHLEKLKIYLKNHVPLEKREALLLTTV